jgi:hypothetical protein
MPFIPSFRHVLGQDRSRRQLEGGSRKLAGPAHGPMMHNVGDRKYSTGCTTLLLSEHRRYEMVHKGNSRHALTYHI